MYYQQQRLKALAGGIFSLWGNWAMSTGSICALIGLAPFLQPKMAPVMAIVFELLLIGMSHRNRRLNNVSCYRLVYITEVILFCSAIALTAVYFYIWRFAGTELTGQQANLDSPQLPVLVVAPISVIVTSIYLYKGLKSSYCFNCMRNSGSKTDRGFLDMLFYRETKFELKLLFAISLLLSAVSWGYYFIRYNNVSVSVSDRYFFMIFPAGVYLIMLIYLGSRYYGMWIHYSNSKVTARLLQRSGTVVRYMHICGDKLLLTANNQPAEVLATDDLLLDVPMKITLPYCERVTEYDAQTYFSDNADYEADIRPIYESHDSDLYQNLFHFAAYIDPKDEERVAEVNKGQWFNLQEVNEMLHHGLLTSALGSELRRIYTVAMAWKTYDKNGRRLYPIRHYRPTFRLRDMRKWDVDYNDPNWVYVSQINQDKHFYHLRRLWNKIITGNR